MNEVKSPFASRTIWFNLLTLFSTSIVAVADHTLITDNPTYVGAVAVIAALVNLGLRVITTSPIK